MLTLDGHLLQICNVSSFFIYSFSVEFLVMVVDVSADLQRLNIRFYFGNTFVTPFSF